MYWGVAAMDLMNKLEKMEKDKIISFLVSCQDSSGGFRPVEGHDPHLLNTLSAVQVAVMYDCLDSIDTEAVVKNVCSLTARESLSPYPSLFSTCLLNNFFKMSLAFGVRYFFSCNLLFSTLSVMVFLLFPVKGGDPVI